MPYGDIDLGQHCFRKLFVAWRRKAITVPNVDPSLMVSCAFTNEKFHGKCSGCQSVKLASNLHFKHSWHIMTSSNRNIFDVTSLCAGNSPSPVNSPHKDQWCGALMFSLIFALYKLLSKQSWGLWFETTSCSLWRHCNDISQRPVNKSTHTCWGPINIDPTLFRRFVACFPLSETVMTQSIDAKMRHSAPLS